MTVFHNRIGCRVDKLSLRLPNLALLAACFVLFLARCTLGEEESIMKNAEVLTECNSGGCGDNQLVISRAFKSGFVIAD